MKKKIVFILLFIFSIYNLIKWKSDSNKTNEAIFNFIITIFFT